MPSTFVPAGLLDHLVRTRGLSRSEARRIVEEMVSFYGETIEAFITKRHRELRTMAALVPEILRIMQAGIDANPDPDTWGKVSCPRIDEAPDSIRRPIRPRTRP